MAGRQSPVLTRALVSAVALFQFTAMVLISLKTSPPATEALALSLAMPAFTLLVCRLGARVYGFDANLMALVLFLCSVGIVTLEDLDKAKGYALEQSLYVCAGVAAMFTASFAIRRVNAWEKWLWPLAGATLALVALPLAIGVYKGGAKNWVNLGGVSIQPSEFGKVSLALLLAIGLSRRTERLPGLVALGSAACLCALLALERDLGAVALYFCVTLIVYFAATSNLPVSLGALGAAALGGWVMYEKLPYVQRRFAAFVNPWADAEGGGWQVIQSLIAVGSGGMFGMGVGRGTSSTIPLYNSDFIFASVCELFGYLFGALVLVAYLMIALRGVSIAMNARGGFHALAALGVSAMLGAQTLLIVGGNMQLLPLTGVTLPFVATGGSSMVAAFLGVGVLMGVSERNARADANDLRRLRIREGDEA